MFDMFYDDEYVASYVIVEDGKIVGEFTAETRRPVDQAIAYRNEKFPGAKLFTNVQEWSNEKEAAEGEAPLVM